MKKTPIILLIILLFAGFLRFYQISNIPHGLYIDEVSIGYNAYTILQTGKDEHGEVFPLFFKAFGEYKFPVYVYLTSLSMLNFGKTEFAIRFPSAFLGTTTVFFFYLFLKLLFSFDKKLFPKKTQTVAALLGSFLLAITPWHIHLSRGGFEMTAALFIFVFAGYYLLKFYQHPKLLYLLLGTIALVTTTYTYQSFRVIAPIGLFVAFYFLLAKHSRQKKYILSIAGLALVLLLPITLFSFTGAGVSRFAAISAFSEYPTHSLIERLFTFPIIFLKNYLSYFSLSFLFATGDGIGRHTVTGIGQFFRWEIIPLLIGIFVLTQKHKTKLAKITLFLLLLAPIPAAFARPSPHTLRSLVLVIPLVILITIGLIKLWENKKRWSYASLILIIFFAFFEFFQYMHLYYTHYPMTTALDWGAEYKQLVLETTKHQNNYDYIFINISLANPEYMKFYNEKIVYQYVDNTWRKPKDWKDKKILYINSPDEKNNKYLKTVPKKHLKDIHYPNLNNDIFAQFWRL